MHEQPHRLGSVCTYRSLRGSLFVCTCVAAPLVTNWVRLLVRRSTWHSTKLGYIEAFLAEPSEEAFLPTRRRPSQAHRRWRSARQRQRRQQRLSRAGNRRPPPRAHHHPDGVFPERLHL